VANDYKSNGKLDNANVPKKFTCDVLFGMSAEQKASKFG